jgi:hypothetical protein
MLIIFGLAALLLLAVLSLVVVLPIMLAVALVRGRRRRSVETASLISDPDSAFVDLVSLEWPREAPFLHRSDPSLG